MESPHESEVSESRSVVSSSLQPHGLHSPQNSPGQNTGVGSLSLLQGIFPTQGSSPGLPHCRRIIYQLSHKGSPRILEWVAYPFSSRSSRPRNLTGVSCIAGGFFSNWAISEAPYCERWTKLPFYQNIPRHRHTTYAFIYSKIQLSEKTLGFLVNMTVTCLWKQMQASR